MMEALIDPLLPDRPDRSSAIPAALVRTRTLLWILPPLLLGSMLVVFEGFDAWFGRRLGYFLGFVVYWGVWCLAVPLSIAGARRLRALLQAPRVDAHGRIGVVCALLVLPLCLAYGYAFPRALSEANVMIVLASAMLAIVNATCEEVLWRGLYVAGAGESWLLGWIYPAVTFGIWHIAPQILYPNRSPGGVYSFVAVAMLLGLAWGWVAFRTRSIRWTILAHILFDFAGLGARLYFDTRG